MKNIAIIPARGGSKGLPGKNIKDLCGKPLIHYTIDAANESKLFDKVVVTTDSQEISDVVGDKCAVIRRLPKLATDDVPLAPVIIHALLEAEKRYACTFNVIWTLQPTSPLRNYRDISAANSVFQETRADSLISVQEETHSLWRFANGHIVSFYRPLINRQKAIPYYKGNGAIFISKRNVILRGDRLGGKISIYLMDGVGSVDINELEDFNLAEYYIKRMVV